MAGSLKVSIDGAIITTVPFQADATANEAAFRLAAQHLNYTGDAANDALNLVVEFVALTLVGVVDTQWNVQNRDDSRATTDAAFDPPVSKVDVGTPSTA